MRLLIILLLIITPYYIDVLAQEYKPQTIAQNVKTNFENKVLPFVASQNDTIRLLLDSVSKMNQQKNNGHTKTALYTELAKKYNNISQSDSALFFLKEAEKYLDTNDISQTHYWELVNQKISTFYKLGAYNKGVEYGFSILEKVNSKKHNSQIIDLGRAKLYSNISNFYIATKQYSIATEYIHKMSPIIEANNDTALLIVQTMLSGIVEAENPNGNIKKALDFFIKSKKLSMDVGMQDQALRSYINIAVSYYKTGQLSLAQETLQEGLNNTNVLYPYPMLAAYSTMGEIYFKNKNYALAESYLKVAIEGAERFNLKEITLYAYDYMYQLSKEQKNDKTSLFYFEKYQELKSQLENKELRKDLHEMEVKFQSAAKDKQIVSKSLELEQQQNRFKNYTIAAIALLLMLLALVAWLRFRNLKQHTHIRELKHEQKITNLKAIIQGEEQERMRVAGDLHDGIGAMVAAIKMDLERIQKHSNQQPELILIQHNLEATSREIREVAHNLLPNNLNQNTLKEALLSYCNKIGTSHHLDIALQYEDGIIDPENDVKLTIYRIFQELLQNIVKHAQADKAYIQVRKKADQIRITVEDNGVGFDPNDVTLGLGLNNIRQRVLALNGILEIDARPQNGSTFFICIDTKAI